MSSDAQDIAVLRYLRQEGLISPAQLSEALEAQAKTIDTANPISLVQALLGTGAITPVQKEALEKRVKTEEKKGTQQLLEYRLLRKLGEGAMGAVYLAEDTKRNRKVALKVLLRKHARDPEFMKRFRRESEAACKLEHPNIVRAFEAAEDLGFHFYVMEYCEGEPLDRLHRKAGIVHWRRALEIILDVARGLKHAHEQGFIHRDIKPANIFVTSEGTSKILDLGLSKNIDAAQSSFQTLSGAVVGTPHYISPEQATSQKAIDGRTDIYSLGATLYHLISGEPPFSGTTLYEILSKHVNAELPNPQDLAENIPDSVVRVLRKMMAKSPDDRYPDCGALIRDVELVFQGRDPEGPDLRSGASTVALEPRKKSGTGRKRAKTYRALHPEPKKTGRGLAVLMALLLGVGLVGAIVLWQRSRPGPGAAETGGSPASPKEAPTIARVAAIEERGSRMTLDLGDGQLIGMLFIKPGTFTMGSAETPRYDWQRSEAPEHSVTITRGYYMARYKVTRGQFAAFVKATKYTTDAEREGKAWGRPPDGSWGEIPGASWRNPKSYTQNDDHPVVCVSWGDAMEFCGWLSKRCGKEVRLPTEAEWEYACRAGTKTTWSFGDQATLADEYEWTSSNSAAHTHEVGLKKPNAWGLYDLGGNAFEWCLDWYGSYGGEATDPMGPPSGERRCLRGGSWANEAWVCRPALRHVHPPWNRDTEDGFRIIAR